MSLRPHLSLDTSVAKALQIGAQQLSYFDTPYNKRIIVLSHDGVTSDLVGETLEAVSIVQNLQISVLVVSGNPLANDKALTGYAGQRERVYHQPNDAALFLEELDKIILCDVPSQKISHSPSSHRISGVKTQTIDDKGEHEKKKSKVFELWQKCDRDLVDLMLVLDTSGSVRSIFELQRRFAINILDQFPSKSYKNGRIQVSVVRFSNNPVVEVKFKIGQHKKEILQTIRNLTFTGSSTRIAAALDTALVEMEKEKRPAAKQVLVLISDGHGQEYWNVVQQTGANLHETDYEIFAVSTGRSYNEAELLIYAGDVSRLFVGPRYDSFIPVFTPYLYGCIREDKFAVNQKLPEIEKPSEVRVRADSNTLPADEFLNQEKIEPAARRVNFVDSKAESLISSKVHTTTSQSVTHPFFTTTHHTTTPTQIRSLNNLGNVNELNKPIDKQQQQLMKLIEKADREKQQLVTTTTSKPEFGREGSLAKDWNGSCEVDLVLIIDRSQSVEEEFEREVITAKRVIEQFPRSLYANGTIRVGIVSFAWDAKVELDLKLNDPDEIIQRLSGIYHTGGTTSTVAGATAAIKSMYPYRRPNARLLILLFSDGYSQDYWRDLLSTAEELQRPAGSAIIAYTASPTFSQIELTAWTGGGPEAVYTKEQDIGFILKVQREVWRYCAGDKDKSVMVHSELSTSMKDRVKLPLPNVAPVRHEAPSTLPPVVKLETQFQVITPDSRLVKEKMAKMKATTTTTFAPKIQKTPIEIKREESDNNLENLEKLDNVSPVDGSGEGSGEIDEDVDGPCKMDLMLIIDISTSVQSDFEMDMQYAIDLTDRLPAKDFEDQVRMGIVTFNMTAQLVHSLADRNSKSALLDLLLAQNNTGGGSTSLANGVSLALEDLAKNRRKNAKQVAVIISDGNSRDEWQNVLKAANGLKDQKIIVYAVSAARNSTKRELEMYTGNKERVYMEQQTGKFLTDVTKEFALCTEKPRSKLIIGDQLLSRKAHQEESDNCDGLIDLILLIDKSKEEYEQFAADHQIAMDLINSLPKELFNKRLAVSLIEYGSHAVGRLALGIYKQPYIIESLQRIHNKRAEASLSAAVNEALRQMGKRRIHSKLYVVIISDGSTSDDWQEAQTHASKLLKTDAKVFAATNAEKFYMDELKEYTGNSSRVYTLNKTRHFVEEVGNEILGCKNLKLERLVNVEKQTPSQLTTDQLLPITTSISTTSLPKLDVIEKLDAREKVKRVDDLNSVIVEAPVANIQNCSRNKIDLQIILDASSSREEVFEAQRELALNLIEKLPISASGTHVAVGINSFTSTPVLRQTLGLGRDKNIVRSVIEDIEYKGGSTLTAQAVELSLEDLERGKRDDATQVVVLMNDGFSQDHWEKVVRASDKLRNSSAEIFGVALGGDIDLRELNRYIPRKDRLYRDTDTDKFIHDITELLGSHDACVENTIKEMENPVEMAAKKMMEKCEADDLDLMIVFDNSDKTKNMSNPAINSNRYLLLDVLGSLSKLMGNRPARVRISVVAVAEKGKPKVNLDFTEISERDKLFAEIESIKAINGKASYSDAVMVGLNHLGKAGSKKARHGLLIVGPGQSDDPYKKTLSAASRIRHMPNFTCLAVDASSNTNSRYLTTLTGSPNTVFDYDGNIEFAQKLHQIAFMSNTAECKNNVPTLNEKSQTKKPVKATTAHGNTSAGHKGKGKDADLPEEILRHRGARKFDNSDGVHEQTYMTPPADYTVKSEKGHRGDKPKQRDVPSYRPPVVKNGELQDDIARNIDDEKQLVDKLDAELGKAIETVAVKTTESKAEHSDNPTKSESLKSEDSVAIDGVKEPEAISDVVSEFVNSPESGDDQAQVDKLGVPPQIREAEVEAAPIRAEPGPSAPIPPSDQISNLDQSEVKADQVTTTSPKNPKSKTIKYPSLKNAINIKFGHVPHNFEESEEFDVTTRPSRYTRPTAIRLSSYATLSAQRFTRAPLIIDRPDGYKPGCMLDVLFVLDSSANDDDTFEKQKQMTSEMIDMLRVGYNNARISIIKFAARNQVKVIHTFAQDQTKTRVLRELRDIPLETEYSPTSSSDLMKVSGNFSYSIQARLQILDTDILAHYNEKTSEIAWERTETDNEKKRVIFLVFRRLPSRVLSSYCNA
ncbi:hypothetical protein WR25_09194 isoform B [Diploscapter pachys]|uniref:VWFA domain-containing protein n=1 Tax=Diploscapter pachys TaxID=2018661 RepID=A0A2A2LYA9_9BILA|nr:hypothetical protein WR25_09194 isoform B [Diploscapter pachys]